jgi:low affinity Fe/Cu permease
MAGWTGDENMNAGRIFGHYADVIAKASGSPITFLVSCVIIAVWAITGPIFAYSDTWQLLINTGTTIVTFLMVFLIQNTQNRDTAAIQAKLDELIRTSAAQNSFIGIEHLPQEEVEAFRDRCAAKALSSENKKVVHAAAHAAGKKAVEHANEIARNAAAGAHDIEFGR